MGILASIFGYVPPEKEPKLVSIFPKQAIQKIQNGNLPTIQADKLILTQNEICHFVDVGAVITEKNRYHSIRTGGSYRMGKGYTAHMGQSQTVPVKEPEYTKGVFYITNKRIIFAARKNGFDKKISQLTSITPYSNATQLQFGSKTCTVLLPDGNVANTALNLLLNGHI